MADRSIREDGGPAFPIVFQSDARFSDGSGDGAYVDSHGMSLRDFFAAHALSGLLANGEWLTSSIGAFKAKEIEPANGTAACAYEIADAMLAQRSKEPVTK